MSPQLSLLKENLLIFNQQGGIAEHSPGVSPEHCWGGHFARSPSTKLIQSQGQEWVGADDCPVYMETRALSFGGRKGGSFQEVSNGLSGMALGLSSPSYHVGEK